MNIIRLDKKESYNKAYIYKSPIGDLILKSDNYNRYITSLGFKLDNPQIIVRDNEPSIIKKAKIELDNYFSKKSKVFNLDIAVYGTDFQYHVWLETSKIPFGSTVTYSYISEKISNSIGAAARAVGTAEGKNEIAIIIPCHRVIGKNKKLTGYAGGIDKKKYLLENEGFNIFNNVVIIK